MEAKREFTVILSELAAPAQLWSLSDSSCPILSRSQIPKSSFRSLFSVTGQHVSTHHFEIVLSRQPKASSEITAALRPRHTVTPMLR